MSSFGGFGGGGFGQSNNQTSGFGFGSNTSSGTGFSSGGFGSNSNNNPSSGSSLFGGGSTGGFGSGGAFGSASNNSFGTKTTGFGPTATPSGTGLFSGNSGTSSSTGFGFGNNPSTTTSGFGGGSGGGLFGSGNKTSGFGSTATTGGSIFGVGSSGASGGGFSSGTSTGFGSAATGLSGNVGDPPGTAAVPFSAFQEKEPNGTATNVFQNLLFQDPYKKWSADELRLADYAQGRKHGNASGAGAFGVSSGFGGSSFGANQTSSGFSSGTTGTGTTLFGSGSNSSGGFGSTNTNTTSGFGSGGGSLFGQNKPASGGLFGNNAQSTTGSAFGSGGFGSTSTPAGGFGSTNNAPGTGGGLFGSNAQQNKPSGFGGFGSGTTTSGFGSNSQTSGFGSTSTTGGGLFGSNTQSNSSTGGGLFGNNQNQPSTTTGGFSSGFSNQNQQQNTGGLFGNNNNQQKPGGLFGSTSASAGPGGGLFGNASNTTSSGFGSNNATSTGGGLFGNTSKPGTTGTGLFGSSTTAQNTGASGGLFGQSNQNQQQNSSLFGNNQAKPSIFGGSTTQNTGSIFGSQSTNQNSSLFGSTATQQQPQQSTFGNSLFGTSQNQVNQQQSLTTSINDVSAFGSTSLFANLGTNDVQNPGPLATPLTNKNKPRKSSILPMYKLNPASASRYATPQKRGGFGFSYSTYGTPGSASSVSSTPGGLNQNLLMGNTSRGLSKSMSTSSLRRSFNTEDTILNPGVFSAGNGQRYGSVKKLVINREMRSDLFSTPQKDKQTPESSKVPKKHVTFEEAGSSNGDATSTALIVADSQADSRSAAPSGSNRTDKPAPEVQPPSEAAEIPPITVAAPAGSDPRPGTKWMKPRKEEIEKMSRAQRQAVEGFTVGRVNVGSVKFLPPVDLTDIDLDTLFQDIVLLETRSATVYPDPAKKPPVGKGLNVPAEIRLEQSWPRAKDKRPVDTTSESRVRKHVERLKRIPDTTFINYDKLTGVWTFRVEHFTTYGLEYDEESDTEVTNAAIDAPVIPTAVPAMDSEESSPNHTDPDDTFEFRAKRRVLPGAFDSDYQEELDTAMEVSHPQSFLADRSAGSTSNALIPVETGNEVEMEDEYGVAEDAEVASPYPSSQLIAEPQLSSPEQDRLSDVETPGGIMRARMRAIKDSATPIKVRVADGDDWMDMLQRTISPQKRDRVLLKSLNADENYPSLKETMAAPPMMTKPPVEGRGFATSIDLMNSLFEKAKAPPAEPPMGSRGFVKVGF